MSQQTVSRAAALFIFAPLLAWSQNPDPGVCAQPDYTTGLFTCNGIDCPPEGAGARPILNRLKNRDILPVELEPLPVSVKDMVDWHRGEVLPYVWEHRSQLIGPDRAAWQKPDQIMDALGIADGSTVAVTTGCAGATSTISTLASWTSPR